MMRTAKVLSLILFLTLASYGQENVSRAVLPLDSGKLTWIAGQGLAVEYYGRQVFLPCASELTLHDAKWTTHYYSSRGASARATLTKRNGQHILSITFPTHGFHATEVITAGPGDRFSVEYQFGQERWNDASLQLGFSKPAERFWMGSRFRAVTQKGEVKGTIPLRFDPAKKHAFRDATEVELSSVFANLRIVTDRPVTLYDYENRHGAFWIGFDERLPRGEEQSFRIDVELSKPRFDVDGLVLSGLSVPDRVEAGLLRVAMELSRRVRGPRRVRMVVKAARKMAEPIISEVAVKLSRRPRKTSAKMLLAQPGSYRLSLALSDDQGQVMWSLDDLPLTVVTPLCVTPNLSLYTTEQKAALLVRVRSAVPADDLRFTAEGGGLSIQGRPAPGQRTTIAFAPAKLRDGASTLRCQLLRGQQVLAETDVTLRKAPPQDNEVKIDYVTRGLIVDGLPLFPFGAYCFHPPTQLATEEAATAFTHLAPYRRTTFLEKGAREEMLAALDRCASVGIKVHYDLRKIATLPDTPSKWDLLRKEVEAVRRHPALLCWYLVDEPTISKHEFPPELMEQAYQFVKELDPYHPCTMVFANWHRAPEYAAAMDIVMTDPYPIPQGSVTRVAHSTASLDEAMGYTMPVWVVPQAFGGGEWWLREPTVREERVMTYLALIHGARGIQYFMRVLPNVRPMTPSLWAECRWLAAEVAELTPDLLSPFPQPQIGSSLPDVHVAGWATDDALVILAANTVNRPQSVEFTVPGAPDTHASVLFENRNVTVKNGVIQTMIDAFGTRAFRIPLREMEPLKGISLGNLTKNPSFESSHNVGTPDGYYISAGNDPAAAVHVDARVAHHGRHSLRVTTPTEGGGLLLSPFPIPLVKDRRYRFSFWAKSRAPGARVWMQVNGIDTPAQTFRLSTEWQKHQFTGRAVKSERRGQIRYRLQSAGVAWVDLLQAVPIETVE